jgi:hypothetical protein
MPTRPSLTALATAALIVLFLPGVAGATNYYVSPRGDDQADGMSEATPWRTLTKASSVFYGPGDALHLKRGGRWTGETLSLRGGGSSFAPNFVLPYGPDASFRGRPLIAPGTVDSTALRIEGGSGWLISGLELANARWGVELRYDGVTDADYLFLEDLDIHDMSTLNSNPEKFNFGSAGIAIRQWTDDPGSPTFLRNLTVRNVTMRNTDFAVWTGAICEGTLPGGDPRCNAQGFSLTGLWAYVDGFSFDNVRVVNAGRTGLSLSFMKNGSVTNSSVQTVGYLGWQYGTAGSTIAWMTNVRLDHFDIANVSRGPQPYDGCGFDFEGGTTNVTYRNSQIDTSDGAGFCVFDNGGNAGPNKNMLIENVAVTRFGRNPGNHDQGVLFGLVSLNRGYHTGVARNCRFNNAYNRPFIGTMGIPQQYSTTDPSAAFFFDHCDFSRTLTVAGAAAHSSEPGFPASNAVDGNPSTYWKMLSTAPFPQSFWVDFGYQPTITRIEATFHDVSPWKLQLLGSNDGLQTLDLIADYSGGVYTGGVAFDGVVSYHWPVVKFLDGGGYPATLTEFTVFGH